MPHQVLCPILQGNLLADPCGFRKIYSHHDQLALKNSSCFFYQHRFLRRTIHYNTIFSPLEITNIPKLTYFTMQHAQTQRLLREDTSNSDPFNSADIQHFQHVMN